jgi:hypothetical protein
MVRKSRSQMSKDERGWNSSLKEKPVRSRPRRLVDWINLTGAKKVHSLIDKVYKRKNLEMAWGKVKENRGSGGVDGQSLAAFEKRYSIGWSPSSSRYSMMPALAIGEGDRRRTRCARSGRRFKAGRSGSWTGISEIFSGLWIRKNFSRWSPNE